MIERLSAIHSDSLSSEIGSQCRSRHNLSNVSRVYIRNLPFSKRTIEGTLTLNRTTKVIADILHKVVWSDDRPRGKAAVFDRRFDFEMPASQKDMAAVDTSSRELCDVL
jgi:hypothetical protein